MPMRSPMNRLASSSRSPPISQFGPQEDHALPRAMELPWNSFFSFELPVAEKASPECSRFLVMAITEVSRTVLLRKRAVDWSLVWR